MVVVAAQAAVVVVVGAVPWLVVVLVAAQAAVVVGAVPWKSEELDDGDEEFGECGEDERVDAMERADARLSDAICAICDTDGCPLGAWSRCAIVFLHAGPSSLTS